MTEQHGVRPEPRGLATISAVGIGPNSPSMQPHVMAVVDQRPADREQPKRRQMIVRDAAADGGMRDIDQKDAHGFSVRTRVSVAAAHAAESSPPCC